MEKKKSESSWKILVTIIVTAFITFILTSVGVIRIMNNNDGFCKNQWIALLYGFEYNITVGCDK